MSLQIAARWGDRRGLCAFGVGELRCCGLAWRSVVGLSARPAATSTASSSNKTFSPRTVFPTLTTPLADSTNARITWPSLPPSGLFSSRQPNAGDCVFLSSSQSSTARRLARCRLAVGDASRLVDGGLTDVDRRSDSSQSPNDGGICNRSPASVARRPWRGAVGPVGGLRDPERWVDAVVGLETYDMSCDRRWRLAGEPVLCRWSTFLASREVVVDIGVDDDGDAGSLSTPSVWGFRLCLLTLWRWGEVGVLVSHASWLGDAFRDVIGLLRLDAAAACIEYITSGACRLARLCLAVVGGTAETESYCCDSCLIGALSVARRKYASNSSSFSIVVRQYAIESKISFTLTAGDCRLRWFRSLRSLKWSYLAATQRRRRREC